MALKLITPPAVEPLTLVQAKAHLRVVDSDDDTLISALIIAARQNAENWMGRALIDQTWDLYLDGFPTASENVPSTVVDMAIQIPKPPLIQVVQVAYDNTNGDEILMNPNDYYADVVSEPGWLVLSGLSSWPTTIDAINSVRVRFRAGYLSTDSPPVNKVPEDILSGVKLLLGTMYEHREQQVVGTIANKLPFGVEQLLRHHRVLLGMA